MFVKIRALRELHKERIWKSMHMDAVQALHALGPSLRQLPTAATRQIEAGAPRVFRAKLEAGRIDDAVDLIFHVADNDAFFVDPLDALAVGVDQSRARRVERLEIFIVEARALAKLPIPGPEFLRCFAMRHDGVDPRADFLHLFEIGIFERRQHRLRRQFSTRHQLHLGADPSRQIGPAVLNQVFRRRPTR